MAVSARIASTFAARPVLRPIRRLCEQLEFDVSFSYAPDSSIHVRHPPNHAVPDWDVIFVRVQDWIDDRLSHRERDEQFEVNVRQLVESMAPTTTSFSRGAVICLCPSDAALYEVSPELAGQERALIRQLRDLDTVNLVTPSEIVDRYSVNKVVRRIPLYDELVYTNEFYTALAANVVRVIHAHERAPFKVIAVDADYTLWDGACSEAGARGVQLGPGRQSFQSALLALRRRGALLCLVTQNDYADVAMTFSQHESLPLALDDFVMVEADWTPKPAMLRKISESLDLPLDSFVFIDDNPGECARMRAEEPAVLTIRFPPDDAAVPRFLQHLWALDMPRSTVEDRGRTESYRAEACRRQTRALTSDRDEFIANLDLDVVVREATVDDVPRIVQLSERTTQFNMFPRRLSNSTATSMIRDNSLQCAVVTVADRFGDYGLTGVVTYTLGERALSVDTWMLSCRVLHRDVEYLILQHLVTEASVHDVDLLTFRVTETARNLPARHFLNNANAQWVTSADGATFAEVTIEAALAASPSVVSSDGDSKAPVSSPHDGDARSGFLAELAEQLTDATSLHEVLVHNVEKSSDGSRRPYGLWIAALKQIWEDALSIRDLAISDDLFGTCGATSVDVLVACSEVHHSFGVSLSLGDALALSTIADQAHALMRLTTSPVPTVAQVRAGNGLPIVFFAPAGGLAYAYLELVRQLDRKHTVYVAQAPELTSRNERLLNLTELVEAYTGEIEQRVGRRPIVLAGWSFGAIVAYEAAVAFENRGVKMPSLLLFDPPRADKTHHGPGAETSANKQSPRGASGVALAQFFSLLDPYSVDASSLAELDRAIFPDRVPLGAKDDRDNIWNELLTRLLDDASAQQRNRLLIPELAPTDVLRAACVWKKNQQLADEYQPTSRYCGHVQVFVTGTSRRHVLSEVLRGKAQTVSYPVAPVAGLRAHSAMMEKENVQLFARDVVETLRIIDDQV